MAAKKLRKDWEDLTRQDVVELSKIMSGLEIAKCYGVHHNTVYWKFRVLGLTRSRKNRTFNPDRKELAELYKTHTMAELAKHYGVGETVVFTRLKEYGIAVISRSVRLTGKPKSMAHRLEMSRSTRASGVRAGSNNGNWNGGTNSANKSARSKVQYAEWKADVFQNAGWKCESCGKEHGSVCECCGHKIYLHAHHLKSFDEFPDLRYTPSNGKALCERCHYLVHYK